MAKLKKNSFNLENLNLLTLKRSKILKQTFKKKNKNETPTWRQLSWGKVIWGQTDRPTDQRTDQQMKSIIEALACA
jgi:hypothetical protein